MDENIRGRVRLETTGMSVLSRRNPASAIDREETERRELRVTLRAERIHRGGSGRVREGLLEKRRAIVPRRDVGVSSRPRRRFEKSSLFWTLRIQSKCIEW